MRKTKLLCVLLLVATVVMPILTVQAAAYEWRSEGGKSYWYENGVKQGVPGDPKNITDQTYHTERGREIYDPGSDGWYWLDSVYNGAKAVGKEVWMPYIYQNELTESWDDGFIHGIANESDAGMSGCVFDAIKNKSGKWVRYDNNGAMLKGWVTISGKLADLYPSQAGNTYYYDHRTGLMAKGWVELDGAKYHFDEVTGVLAGGAPSGTSPVDVPTGSLNVKDYGAKGNGTGDDTAAFNKAIAAAVSGKGNIYVPAGTYNIKDSSPLNGKHPGIEMRSNTHLYMDPNAVLQFTSTGLKTYNVIYINEVTNVSVEGGQIRGDRYIGGGTNEDACAIGIYESNNITVANCNISASYGDGIYLGTTSSDGYEKGCSNVVIRGCNISDNRRSNISIVLANIVTVENCTISNANGTPPQCGINIEPNYFKNGILPKCEHIYIKNTTINGKAGDKNGQFFTLMTHYYPSDRNTITSNDLQVSNCTFNGDCGLYSTTNAVISNTTINGCLYDRQGASLNNVTYSNKFGPW